MRLGIKKTVLKRFVPLSPFVKRDARAKEMTFIVITETTANLTVNHKALRKSLLEKARI